MIVMRVAFIDGSRKVFKIPCKTKKETTEWFANNMLPYRTATPWSNKMFSAYNDDQYFINWNQVTYVKFEEWEA